ncbi:MAG: PHP domain-containing protein [Methylococcales bacterium]|nr:PHP domain-containing protein [Methylococcales bacterium]
MTSSIDFHTHSIASDGQLSPTQLVRRASEKGVRVLALTDHDTTHGIEEAAITAKEIGVHLVPGIELSVTWNDQNFHMVGLGIDPLHPILASGIREQQELRLSRAREIGRRLNKNRIEGAFEGAALLAGNGMLTRTHFARYLVDQNRAATLQKAFDQFLKRGKPGYVPTRWAPLETGIQWVTAAGGIAVLAHPQRYKISTTRLKRLLTDFKTAGGQAIEVVCGNSSNDDVLKFSRHALDFGLLGSVGSDFHSPENRWIELGRLRPFPNGVSPVWVKLGIASNPSSPAH